MSGIESLRSLSTKRLLELKQECYRSFWISCSVYFDGVYFNYQELKQVLSERPHIPNRVETKHIRKTAAKYKIRIH